MKYIVEVPQATLEQLQQAVRDINPEAGPPIGVGMDDEDHIMTLGRAEWWYEDMVRHDPDPKLLPLLPWNELGENAQETMAGFLSGFIGIQFEDFSRDGLQECLEVFLEEHTEFVQKSPEAAG